MRIDLHLGKLGGVALALGLAAWLSFATHHPALGAVLVAVLVLFVVGVLIVSISRE